MTIYDAALLYPHLILLLSRTRAKNKRKHESERSRGNLSFIHDSNQHK